MRKKAITQWEISFVNFLKSNGKNIYKSSA